MDIIVFNRTKPFPRNSYSHNMDAQPLDREQCIKWENFIKSLFNKCLVVPIELTIRSTCELIYHRTLLGRGSYGEVHKAYLKSDGTEVAAKRLSALQDQHGYIKNDVVRDLWFMNMLKHKNIVHLHFICIHARKSNCEIFNF